MTNGAIASLRLPTDPVTWPSVFREAQLDCIIDPMILRAAEFFIGGPNYCRRMAPEARGDYWSAIDSNLDGVLAFFHILMTRDRVAFIDYWDTYSSEMPEWLGDSIVLRVFGGAIYPSIKQKALDKLANVADTLPMGASLDQDKELLEFGNFWQPGLGNVSIGVEKQSAARFALGGLIFGEYAQLGGADHLLQSKRLRLMSDLGDRPAEPLPDWIAEETVLFEQINKLANTDGALSLRDWDVLPNVLLYLLADRRRKPREILDEAIKLRESAEGKSYRAMHRRLREAWLLGRKDEPAEDEVKRVAVELSKRILGQPMRLTGLSVKGKLEGGIGAKVDLGIINAHVRATGSMKMKEKSFSVSIPDSVRNWFVDRFVLKSHQKLLLRMAIKQATFEHVRRGLREVWRTA